MKAAVFENLEKMVVKDIKRPVCEDNGMVIKVKTCAVCGSDIRIYHFGNPRVKPPVVIGHEVAGEVAVVGKNIRKFKAGDKIAIGADVPCGECEFCQTGLGNNCKINYAIGYQFQGGFAEYMPLNEITMKYGPVHKIPEGISFEEASLAEPLGCCINGFELAEVKLGDVVVVMGAGPVGCMLTQLARISGAKKIILSQRSAARLELAKKFGADVFINAVGEEFIQRVMDETDGRGADVIFTACSSKSAQMDALQIVAQRGTINFFGGLPKGKNEITIDSNIIHYKECKVLGTHGSVPKGHKLALDLIGSGHINVKNLISHRFKLDRIHDAFKAAENHEGMKVVVEC